MVTQKTIDKYIGKTFNKIKVLNYSHNTTPSHVYFNCECLNCGNSLKMRPDGILSNKIGCNKCMGKWRADNFKKIYSHLEPKHLRFRKTHLKNQANHRGYVWNLTDDQVFELLKQPCHYCGITEKIGIDRMNNDIGYEYTNCVPCCGYCNKLKMNDSLEKFIKQINNIYKHYIKKSSTTIPKGSTLQANGSGNGRHLSTQNKDIEMMIWSDLHGDMQLQNFSA